MEQDFGVRKYQEMLKIPRQVIMKIGNSCRWKPLGRLVLYYRIKNHDECKSPTVDDRHGSICPETLAPLKMDYYIESSMGRYTFHHGFFCRSLLTSDCSRTSSHRWKWQEGPKEEPFELTSSLNDELLTGILEDSTSELDVLRTMISPSGDHSHSIVLSQQW